MEVLKTTPFRPGSCQLGSDDSEAYRVALDPLDRAVASALCTRLAG
jgi:hypothetical protein